MRDYEIIIIIMCKLQTLVHSLDDLHESKLFKNELKKSTNSYLKIIEKKINSFCKSMSVEESEYFNKVVKMFDDVSEKIEFEKDEM